MKTSCIAHVALALACLGLAGCETIGSLDGRAQSVNEITAKYSAKAILYNIVRAKQGEPLNFVSIGAVTGHNTFNGGIGLPAINIGPAKSTAQHMFTFGPNSLSASEGTDYSLNVMNDPQSYAALLRPVDTATIGFLLNMYYNRDTALFLFVSKIQVLENNKLTIYENEPFRFNIKTNRYEYNPNFESGFYKWMYWFIDKRLSVAVDPTFVPTYTKLGNARFCFDDRANDFYTNAAAPPPHKDISLCSKEEDKIYAVPYEDSRKSAGADQNSQGTSTANPQGPIGVAPKELMDFVDRDGDHVRVYTRSVLDAYRYLGILVNLHEMAPTELQKETSDIFYKSPDVAAIYVTHDTSNCWVAINYDGHDWCVPDNARETKKTFAMLHQLMQLYTAGKDVLVTPTVRLTQ